MLRIETSRLEKLYLLVLELLQLLLGIPLAIVALVALRREELSGGAQFAALASVAFGTLLTITFARRLVDDWFFGKIHTGIIVNSRTLAIVPRCSRAVLIKRRDCVAAKSSGEVLLLANGEEQALRQVNVGHESFQKTFLEPLYSLWWPETPLKLVRETLAASQPSLAPAWAVWGATLFILFGSVLLHLYVGSWASTTAFLTGTLVVACAAYRPLQGLIGALRHNAYYFVEAPRVVPSASASERGPC